MVIKYKSNIKLFLKLFYTLVLSGCLYILITEPLVDEYLFIIPFIILCLYAWIYIQMYRLEITEDKIHVHSFLVKKTINFREILKISMYNHALEVKSKNKKIKISTDLSNQKEAIIFILTKLKYRKDLIKITGDKNFINKYLS